MNKFLQSDSEDKEKTPGQREEVHLYGKDLAHLCLFMKHPLLK